jgi:DNA invertase Pin-like site-specific DNA recombinase
MRRTRSSPPTTSSRRIGYARVSTKAQDLERQLRALKAQRCDQIFSDTASGKSLAGRPQLRRAIDALAPGDELVIAEWDRATRSMWDGLQILKEITDAHAIVRVLDRTYIDLTTPMGRGFMAFMSAMAEDERERIIRRTHEGRTIAIERGAKMGRSHSLNEVQRAEALQRLGNPASTT